MPVLFAHAVPVLPAEDLIASLHWWTAVCGFAEIFRHGEPASYAGLQRGPVQVHLSAVDGAELARAVGAQTMLRLGVVEVAAFYEEYRERGGVVHPNSPLARKPWGSLEFAAIDPCGVCVTFFEVGPA